MLVEKPVVDQPMIVVIPENEDASVDAHAIATALRRMDWPVDIAFRGNAKRRFELARKRPPQFQLSVIGAPQNMVHLRFKAFGNNAVASPDQFESLMDALHPLFPFRRNDPDQENGVFKAHISRRELTF